MFLELSILSKEIIAEAHAHDVPVLIDGAQAAPHLRIDVQDLDADFYAFSAHKMYGPAGVGVLYGKRKWLEMMPPYQGGGEMIESVSFEKTTYAELPISSRPALLISSALRLSKRPLTI